MTDLKDCLVERRYLDGARKQALEVGRNRLLVVGAMLTIAFFVITGRLADLTVFGKKNTSTQLNFSTQSNKSLARSDILDRNGIVLATSLPTTSLYADPSKILDVEEIIESLGTVLPDLGREKLSKKLKAKGRFIWLARNLSPQLQFKINRLGLPGIEFLRSEKRVYPHGRLAAHILGLTNIDGKGVAGIEKYFDKHLSSASSALNLSIDLRVQSILQEELGRVVFDFKAIGAAGIIMDVRSGEVLAMVSLPDYDPNFPNEITRGASFNRATKGVYEMGSTFKLFTVAAALDMKIVDFSDGYDASKPIRVSRFSINDFHAEKRWLSVPEIILYSSNIGAAKIGKDIGTKNQKDYFSRFGLLDIPKLELPEVSAPLFPRFWRPINTMTISFGHGIAVSPIQLISGVSSIVNGGRKHVSTILKQREPVLKGERILSEKTSEDVRRLMRLVVKQGTGKKAKTGGYLLGGKTGTAEKSQGRTYSKSAKISSFIGAFPIDKPRYSVLVLIDEPKGNKSTSQFATGGWVAAPAVGRIVRRIGPIFGIAPDPKAELELPIIQRANQKKAQTMSRQKLLKRISWNTVKN